MRWLSFRHDIIWAWIEFQLALLNFCLPGAIATWVYNLLEGYVLIYEASASTQVKT